MNAGLRRRLEMAARVRDFLRAHKTDNIAEGTALARLEVLLERANVLAAQQLAGIKAQRSATEQRAEVRRGLQGKLLRYLAGVGRLAAMENAELGAQFRLPQTTAPNQAFVTLVHGMLEKAKAHRTLLVTQGMSDTLLDDITKALAEFEETLEASRTGHRDQVGASADLDLVSAEMTQLLRMLDGLVRYRFGDNGELMGAWKRVRNVLGPFRPKAEPEAGDDETPIAVKPAA